MRAAVTRIGGVAVEDIEEPVPGPGQVLVRTLACGICGSDLHAAADLRRFAGLVADAGGPYRLDPDSGVVFGHEFCAEVLAHGPDTQRALPVGARVCSVPVVAGPNGFEGIGYSNRYPGGLAERMVLQEALLLPVPDGLSTEAAALTEPLAVGEHAVQLARLTGGEACLVIGCGPIGLAVIAALKARGHGPVVAADFSAPRRRLAELLGADEVLDPADASPYATLGQRDAVIFEAVGVPGILRQIVRQAPQRARVVVVGVCMEPDQIDPFYAVTKELEVRFSFGYRPEEFAATLERLGRGELPVGELVARIVGLDGVAEAFAALGNAALGKVLVRP
jgi:2-desacetyl-2-hydroxyethyl bacteriochlorophyllide A dehydrogenase